MARNPPRRYPEELTELDSQMAWRRIVVVLRKCGVTASELEDSWAGRWLAAAELVEWMDRKIPEEEGRPVRPSASSRAPARTRALRQ